jgi:CheY-like chemotaxis protein
MNKTIMIVEDDASFHNLYKEVLGNTGYKLIHTYDGDEALVKLEEKRPDLIILDIILDMMTGDTFFLYLKGMPEYADIPVIISSCCPKKDYKNLRNIDPSLVFLDKTGIGDELITKIKTRIG